MSKRNKPSPLPYQATITSLSHEGRGVATLDGKKKFLRGGLADEIVIARDIKKHRSFDEGEVMEVMNASPDRVTPKCIHTQICGGCSLQHFDSAKQIQFKQNMLLEQLKYIAGVQPDHILPPLLSPVYGYRNKARLGVKFVGNKEKVLVGFREPNGRYLADIQSCVVLHPSVGEKITALSEMIGKLKAYQTIPQIEVAVGEDATALVFRHLQPLCEEDLTALQQFGEKENFRIYLQSGGIESITPLSRNSFYEGRGVGGEGTDLLSYSLKKHNITLQFHPSNFTQINPFINTQMIDRAIELLALKPDDHVLDLFCGLGNFTLPLSRYCGEIIGVEGDDALVARATSNAQLNDIQNAKFYAADLSKDFSNAEFMKNKFNKILIDPPRTGALEAVKLLPALQPELILYVSCNPATLARDAKELIERGYTLTHAGVMDMFPHTSHVESIALFVRT